MAPNAYWYDGMMDADDHSAIELLMESKAAELAGISECFHNSERDEKVQSEIEKKTSLNVYRGAQKPIIIHNSIARDYSFPQKDELPESGYAWDAVYKAARKEGKLTLLCAGSLTNIALTILRYPDIVDFVERIVFIAGTVGIGDSLAMSDDKAALDPYAVKTVLTSGVKLLYVGNGSWTSDRVPPVELVSSVLNMGKLKVQKANMDIETVGCDQFARTVIDTRVHSKAEKNVDFVYLDHRQ